ncbi:outer membrane protein [Aminobacter sp. Piv2-1]|uniref:outer membrane protein n=1 Tax=Aminobacter sp. Piv2-1 TaxID=3031122 RepID=UPI0030ADF9AD
MSPAAFAEEDVSSTSPSNPINWSGGYVGLHAGGGWGTVLDVNNPRASEQDIDGALGGIQAGYNYQFSNNVVFGIEADVSLGDVGANFDGRTVSEFNTYYTEDKIEALGTLRARLGYAADRFMPYLTGGLAWARIDHTLGCDVDRVDVTLGCQANGGAFETSKSDTSVGWTAGGGVEFALTEKWTLKGEYLYTDLGKNKVTLIDPNRPGSPVNERNFETKFSQLRLGVNYRF